ncbi:MAG: dihydrofolate reductase family protein [Candidatus Shapirobacteria bacterium]|nr:dihydrofolate reductase family protein [Candidatus Shapirobacteria bacterium]
MIESLDGKISTGDVDELDVDTDFKRIRGIKEGLFQYYDIEKTTDAFSLNTGRVMAKIGVNTRKSEPVKIDCNFVIIDNKPHLTAKGLEYLAKWVNTLFLVTSNKDHPVFLIKNKYPNIQVIYYENKIDFIDLFFKLKTAYHAERVTIQSGGTLNAELIRLGLIDAVSIVIAPCLIGGSNTQSLIGGESLHTQEDLLKIKALKLKDCRVLKNSYIHLLYDVINNTVVEEI